jgi:hypothetical protein
MPRHFALNSEMDTSFIRDRTMVNDHGQTWFGNEIRSAPFLLHHPYEKANTAMHPGWIVQNLLPR